MATNPDLLTRIRNICEVYRGGKWSLFYDSDDGGFWSLQLKSPPEEHHDAEPRMLQTPMGFSINVGPPEDYPIFSMRCQELEVIAEAIEHWHASVQMREPRQG